MNNANEPYTFSTDKGEDNIDVTFTSGSLLNNIVQWKVYEDMIQSDHRYIELHKECEADGGDYEMACVRSAKQDVIDEVTALLTERLGGFPLRQMTEIN